MKYMYVVCLSLNLLKKEHLGLALLEGRKDVGGEVVMQSLTIRQIREFGPLGQFLELPNLQYLSIRHRI